MRNTQLNRNVLARVEWRLECLLQELDAASSDLQDTGERTELDQLLSIHAHLTKLVHDEHFGVPTA